MQHSLFSAFAVLTLTATTAQATTVAVHAPCTEALSAAGNMASSGRSVGSLTIKFLDEQHVEYIGDDSGIVSILGTPHGNEALEVIDDDTMRAYGWCYQVDGVEPDVMPDQYFLKGDEKAVTWFYAYSLYDHGMWKEYCTPVHETRPDFICANVP